MSKPAKIASKKDGKATAKVVKQCAISHFDGIFTAIDAQRQKRVSHGTNEARVRTLAGRKGYEVIA